jgi:hypothetical protein
MAVGNPSPLVAKMDYKRVAFGVALALFAVAAVVAVSVNMAGEPTFESLAAKKAAKAKKLTPLTYGSSITLMTDYNEYVVHSKSGKIYMDGFMYGDDVFKIVNPKGGKKGPVKYGDKVAIMGTLNKKYLLCTYSGKVAGRTSVIGKDTEWTIVGGSGPVMLNDRVSFKNEYGFLRVSKDGTNSNAPTNTASEKYLIGLPGQETGLKLANGLHYGEVIELMNPEMEFLQIDHNGWGTMGGRPLDNWHHFAVLSSLHREGVISYGDKLIFRAHNGRFVSVREDNRALEAVSRAITDQSEFTIVGGPGFGSGYVKSRDMVALRCIIGYIDSAHGETRVKMAPDGHYGPNNVFQMLKVWDSSL